jgi:enoyl-CoA hydratase/carnithine racemase
LRAVRGTALRQRKKEGEGMTPQGIHDWLQSIKKQNGFEILLVQTLRNALMSASVIASTSLVAIIGVVSIGRAFSGGSAESLRYGHWAIHIASVILAIALTEALLSLRTLARAGFVSGFGKSSGDELDDAEKFAAYLASALRQLSRAAVALSIGMAVAVIGGIMFAW